MPPKINELREKIDSIDRSILNLVNERTQVALEIGLIKANSDLTLRNFEREKICIENAREHAKTLGMSEDLAEEILLKLIQASLLSQEKDRVRMIGTFESKKAVIIGGCGKMGRWFADFLSSSGYLIDILDNNSSHECFTNLKSIDDVMNHDLIVVAAPLKETNEILLQIAKLRPKGLIFDVASLKGPLREGLAAIATSELNATSIHPMFGPNTSLLSNRHVIVVDLGNKSANIQAASLFSATTANIVHMDAENHDRNMAFLLGLSHAVNLVFSKVLAKSEEKSPSLNNLSSVTFDSQMSVAMRVATESPKLYFEIQALNPFGDVSLKMLEDTIKELRQIVLAKDFSKFDSFMGAGRDYFEAHRTQKGSFK